ncbi:hypothetical protein AB6806_04725 [Bosea sp. RCC_152_1]|uniref:hypothetical protein n=1 Tax=Bosea sp. RCC_152_1 TaxID=3239228 RepID=UPI0035262051
MTTALPAFTQPASFSPVVHGPQLDLFAPLLPLPAIPSQQHQRLGGGTHEACVYIAGATHLRSYLKPLGITAYKIGVTGRRSTWNRIMDLRANRYAGVLRNERTQEVTLLEDGDDWFQMPLHDDNAGLWELPAGVAIDRSTIVLTMSTRIPIERLDDRIHAALAPRDLRRYLLGEEGQARLRAAGYDPHRQLWTNYSLANDGRRPSAASELYLFRPRRELRDLLTCLGDVVAAMERELDNQSPQHARPSFAQEV